MNDLTKEELSICSEGLAWLIESHSSEYSPREVLLWRPVMDKIQSLIDNFCEHEALGFVGDVYGYDCKRCEKRFTSEEIDPERHDRIMNGEE